jgi:murein DD-endopeptidase MepM/ murein hydrolase activator NlpD
MFPKKHGVTRNLHIPFEIIMTFFCLLGANTYFLLRYPMRINEIISLEQTISNCKQTIAKQEKELKRVEPAIKTTHEIEGKINNHNKLAAEFEAKYNEVKSKNVSKTKVSRSSSYRPFQLPQYQLSSADTELTKLSVLNGNLDFLEEELRSSDDKLRQLYSRFHAYDLELDYTPTIYPLVYKGYITSYFGYRRDPVTGKLGVFHEGLDIGARTGTPIRATAAGIVKIARRKGNYGLLVEIKHGSYGFSTRYAHNSKLLVKEGQEVKKGDIIAYVGSTGKSTGPHLHYEVRLNGKPINPKNYLP